MKRRNLTTPIVYLIMLGIIVLLVSGFDLSGDKVKKISYSEFIDDVRNGRIQAAEVTELKLVGLYSDSKISRDVFPQEADFYTYIPSVDILKDDMDKVTAELTGREANDITQADYPFSLVLNPAPGPSILETLLPYILLFGGLALFYVLMTRAQGGGNNIMNFGKSRARTNMDGRNKVTFADVAGAEEEKEELREVVEFMRSPKRFTAMGARIPKGCLLVGPPGTGKTLLAKAVAGEAGVPFFSISGSDFVEMFVGVGASRVRDLFRQAKEKAPCIVFIDEIDAVGRARGKNVGFSSNDERENTLNQLLTEMDGFGTNSGVIVLAATNRADILDKALLRAGRFDRQIHVELPELKEREEIFKVHIKDLKLSTDFDVDFMAKHTPGFSGADIANVCNEAALTAARKNKPAIDKQDFLDAVDRIVGGLERKSSIITNTEKKSIAHHEAGHAAVSWLLPYANPLFKVTLIPRGQALGAAWYLPEERKLWTKSQMVDEMCALIGGRVAEEIVNGEPSTGAQNDLEKLTQMAYGMVKYYGMSDNVGALSFYDSTGARGYDLTKPYSEQTAEMIDDEVRKIVKMIHDRTYKILSDHKEGFLQMAALLLEKEVIFAEDVEKILGPKAKPADETENETETTEKTETENS